MAIAAQEAPNPNWHQRFDGKNYKDQNAIQHLSSMNKKLNELNINIKGDIFYVSYNSPYKVFNRRNEAMVEIIYEN